MGMEVLTMGIDDTQRFIKSHKYYPHMSGVSSKYFRQAQKVLIQRCLYEDFIQHQALCLCGVDSYINEHRLYTKPHRLHNEISNYIYRELCSFLHRSGFRRTRSNHEYKAYWYYAEEPSGDMEYIV